MNAARKVANASDRGGSPDAHALVSCGAVQRLQLSDRVVVSLALPIAKARQKTERGYDYADSHAKFRLFLHGSTPAAGSIRQRVDSSTVKKIVYQLEGLFTLLPSASPGLSLRSVRYVALECLSQPCAVIFSRACFSA